MPLNLIFSIVSLYLEYLVFILNTYFRTDPSTRIDIWGKDTLSLIISSTEDAVGKLGMFANVQVCILIL